MLFGDVELLEQLLCFKQCLATCFLMDHKLTTLHRNTVIILTCIFCFTKFVLEFNTFNRIKTSIEIKYCLSCHCQLAVGEVFGPYHPITLKLLGSERSIQAFEGLFLRNYCFELFYY